jgi:hypothetical protein
VEVALTDGHFAAIKAAEDVLAADERFEHLAPASDLVLAFAADCAADRQADHVTTFMERHERDAAARVCYFGVEFLRVTQAAKIAGIRLLPRDDPEIPQTNPLFELDQTIASFAAVPVTGTNTVQMAARARTIAEHALRVLRLALRQTYPSVNKELLRFRLGTSHAFPEGAGGWQVHGDVALPLDLQPDLTPILNTAVAKLPPVAARKSVNEKALLAVDWLDRAVFTSDALVATLFRFFALEALLGRASERPKNGPLALRQMTLSRIATGYFRNPDDTFLQYDQVRSYAVHGEVPPTVTLEQASAFEWAVRETLDQYLTVANEHGFTRRQELLNLLDGYGDRDALITWIRQHGSAEWISYLDNITASEDADGQTRGSAEADKTGPSDQPYE